MKQSGRKRSTPNLERRTLNKESIQKAPRVERNGNGFRVNESRSQDLGVCLNETEELIRIFVASVGTAEKNAK
jgi:hypothetical protein